MYPVSRTLSSKATATSDMEETWLDMNRGEKTRDACAGERNQDKHEQRTGDRLNLLWNGRRRQDKFSVFPGLEEMISSSQQIQGYIRGQSEEVLYVDILTTDNSETALLIYSHFSLPRHNSTAGACKP
ncbi:hypothetical protein J6590_095647 [Homalodisca vitripennis]|nr:hypothetical protein J6590_095647 [Homalodisca vitripennis]